MCTWTHPCLCSLHIFTFSNFLKIWKQWIQTKLATLYKQTTLFSEDSRTSSKCVSWSVVLLFLSQWQKSNKLCDDETQFYFFFSPVVVFVAGIWHCLLFGQKVPQVWTTLLLERCTLFIKPAPFETELMSLQQPFIAFETHGLQSLMHGPHLCELLCNDSHLSWLESELILTLASGVWFSVLSHIFNSLLYQKHFLFQVQAPPISVLAVGL